MDNLRAAHVEEELSRINRIPEHCNRETREKRYKMEQREELKPIPTDTHREQLKDNNLPLCYRQEILMFCEYSKYAEKVDNPCLISTVVSLVLATLYSILALAGNAVLCSLLLPLFLLSPHSLHFQAVQLSG